MSKSSKLNVYVQHDQITDDLGDEGIQSQVGQLKNNIREIQDIKSTLMQELDKCVETTNKPNVHVGADGALKTYKKSHRGELFSGVRVLNEVLSTEATFHNTMLNARKLSIQSRERDGVESDLSKLIHTLLQKNDSSSEGDNLDGLTKDDDLDASFDDIPAFTGED